jgi:hypothetical protein
MNCAEMLRNIFQFEKGHSGIHLARTDAATRVLFLKRPEHTLNYRACGQSMISTEIKSVLSRAKIILRVVQRTKQSFVILLAEHIR